MKRRDILKWTSGALTGALAGGLAASVAAEAADAPPKGAKIAPPPEDEDKAEEELRASEMVGLILRVIHPGQVVTQDYNDGRLTITVDKNNVITDIRIG